MTVSLLQKSHQPALHTSELSYQPEACGVYVHVPFCLKKCAYCSFYSVAGQRQWIKRYVEAMKLLLGQEAGPDRLPDLDVTTIFFGGGTPSVVPAEQLVSLLQRILNRFGVRADELEISVEVNPATIDFAGLVCLRQGGFNRLSIGVQSLADHELVRLGRAHTADDALETFSLARKAGFDNLSLDLMYGLPGQNRISWQQTLEKALSLKPDHLSLYELTVEVQTEFFADKQAGRLELPGEDEILEFMEDTGRMLNQSALYRYEISNFARPGHACRHNVNYWHNGSYLGYGPGAVSCLSGTRTTTPADLELFCSRVLSEKAIVADQETLTRTARFRETVILGLRMLQGVSLSALEDRFGLEPVSYYGETLQRLIDHQMVEILQGNLRLTGQGLLLANAVMSELV